MPLEDWTDTGVWAVDDATGLVVGANTLALTNVARPNDAPQLKKDYGVGNGVAANFEHKFSTQILDGVFAGRMVPWVLGSVAGEVDQVGPTNDSVRVVWQNATPSQDFVLGTPSGGDTWADSGILRRYLTIGASGTDIILKIYSNSNRTNLLQTLTRSHGLTFPVRYLYAINGVTGSGTGWYDGNVFDLDLQEVLTFVSIPDAQALRMINGGTISAWMSPDSTGIGAEGRVIDKADGGVNGYALMVTGTAQIQLSVGGVDSITGNEAYVHSEYTLVIVEFNADGRRMWINNVEVALTNSSDGTLPGDVAGSVFLGARATGMAGGFDGSLDEIVLYDRKLTAGERGRIYNSGAGRVL